MPAERSESKKICCQPPYIQNPPEIERVVIVNDDVVNSGGAAQIMLESVRLLRIRGVQVTVLTGDEGDNSELIEQGVNVVALGGQHILDGSRFRASVRGLYSTAALIFIRNWIDSNDTPKTIYHIHNWHKTLSAAAFLALEKVSSRLVLTTHDFFIACPNGGYYNYPKGRSCSLRPMSSRCLFTNCDKRNFVHKIWRIVRTKILSSVFSFNKNFVTILTVHERMIPLLVRGGVARETMTVLRNPVTRWLNERVKAEKNKYVLFVGRLEADKGVDLLCEAAKLLGAPLHVVGEGPLRSCLEKKYPDVVFHGRLERRQISQLARKVRVVVIPTRGRETFSLVAFEALMSGIPVILSEHALIIDEVVARKIGLSCQTKGAKSILGPLARLLDDDILVSEMSRMAFIEAAYLAPTPEEWVDRLIDIYRQQLASTSQVLDPR